MTTLVLSLTAITDDEHAAVKAWEALGRVGVGLGLEGVQVSAQITTITDEEPAEEDA